MTRGTSGTATKSADIRDAYEHGMPLRVLKRRFHLSDSEVEDLISETRERLGSDNEVGGY